MDGRSEQLHVSAMCCSRMLTAEPLPSKKMADSCGGNSKPTKRLLASRIEESCRKKPKAARRDICPHCKLQLSTKTLRRHRALFFNNGVWITAADCINNVSDTDEPPSVPSLEMEDIIQEHSPVPSEDHYSTDNDDSSGTETCTDSDLEEVWEQSDDDAVVEFINEDAPTLPEFSDTNTTEDHQSALSLVNWLTRFLLSFQAKFFIPDSAINLLIKFLWIFVSVAGRFSPFMNILANSFPKSFETMLRSSYSEQSFTKYVVCRQCSKLYKYSDCLDKVGSQTRSKRCIFVQFPNHSQHARRNSCNSMLLKSVEVASGKRFLYPYKIYCYRSLKASLQQLFLRPLFFDQCEQWKSRSNAPNVLEDVYDGAIWKEFQQLFLSSFSLGLMLNIDWFQPYLHTVSSVGVVYLTIMNLARHVRSKRENIILIGIIPGPNEPKHDVNTYLDPLVEELLLLWKGVNITVSTSSGNQEKFLRCALLCVSCDLPASRKVCGFLSHSAGLGCSKCLKSFPGSVGCMNYSGFNRREWTERNKDDHRKGIERLKKCKSKSEQARLESELGCRYSSLLDLPYFDPIRMHVIDPMHNLFLGSGKQMLKIWNSQGLLLNSHYEKIQEVVDSIDVPSDVGRIPLKIASGFSAFKADQFKNWINIYSIPALFDVLPPNILQSWRYFVLACRILCKHQVTSEEVDLADALLLKFCSKVEEIYGESAVTPNMHLHGHLKKVILDYGPLQEFWCFSFERYNGILGKQPTNNRNIEPQLMKKFLRDNASFSAICPVTFKDDFESIVAVSTSTKVVGSLSETFAVENYKFNSKYCRAFLSEDDRQAITNLLVKLNSTVNADLDVQVNSIFCKYSSLSLKGKVFCSSGKKSKPVVAMAKWDQDLYGLPPTPLPVSGSLVDTTNIIRPVDIKFYGSITYSSESETKQLHVAFVSWFFPHSERFSLGKPAEIWCKSMFESYGTSSFVPIDNIVCRCAHCFKLFNDEQVLVSIPLVE